jgi:hypothetical protein
VYVTIMPSSVERDVCVSTRCNLVLSFLVEMCMVFGRSRTIPCVEMLIEFWSSSLLCVYDNARRGSRTIILLVLVLWSTLGYHCQVSVKLESQYKNQYD